jgi:hypothetical protein
MAWNLSSWLVAGAVGLTGMSSLAGATVLTVGSGGDYSDIGTAWAAATGGDTIRFVDSATYSSGTLFLASKPGLTIESAPGQRATISFSSASWGFYLNANNVTFRDLNLNTEGENSIITAEASPNGSGAVVTGVNFTRSVQLPNYSVAQLVQSAEGMQITYSTFRGSGSSPIGLGVGLGWSLGTTVTVDHSSFDNFMIPINQGSSSGTTDLTITNSAFGIWYDAGWSGGISMADAGPTLSEDYNARYGPGVYIYNPGGASVTSGGNSFAVGTYAGIFAGDTSLGQWQVDPALYTAASDGTTIGAWQVPEPSTFSLVMLGSMAMMAKRRR